MPRYRILDQHGLKYVSCTVVGWVEKEEDYQRCALEGFGKTWTSGIKYKA